MRINKTTAILIIITLGYSMVFFAIDIVVDAYSHIVDSEPYSFWEIFHIFMEAGAAVGLGGGIVVLVQYIYSLRHTNYLNQQTIHMLRGSFEKVLYQKFDEWGLTQAERDVTLLIIKGMNATQIAEARKTAQGTVKAQSTAIFRKIGVSSKAELMSIIIDEFLDNIDVGTGAGNQAA